MQVAMGSKYLPVTTVGCAIPGQEEITRHYWHPCLILVTSLLRHGLVVQVFASLQEGLGLNDGPVTI